MIPVDNKQDMYRRLSAGEFGNTTKQFYDFWEWIEHPDSKKYMYWGVRSLVPGGPCFTNVERTAVLEAIHKVEDAGYKYNISMMIDRITTVTLWAEVMRWSGGLYLYGISDPDTKRLNWRQGMPTEGREYKNSSADILLKSKLNENSYDDLQILLDKYPGHVIELSACSDCIGVIPHRNAIIWEVRGGY